MFPGFPFEQFMKEIAYYPLKKQNILLHEERWNYL